MRPSEPSETSKDTGVGPPSLPVAAVVYNPIKVDLQQLRGVVRAAQQRAGWGDSVFLETSQKDLGAAAAASACERGVAVVLAVGGDGTIRVVSGALRGTGIPLAVVPCGTGNLLARNLHLPLDSLQTAVDVAFIGEDVPIDVGIANIRRSDGTRDQLTFAVMAGLGLDADMIASTDTDLKRRIGWLAYLQGIAVGLAHGGAVSMRTRMDGGPVKRRRVRMLLVGNCGLLTGDVLLLPQAVLNDGLLNVLLLRPHGPFEWVRVLWNVLWKNDVLRRTRLGRRLIDHVDASGVTGHHTARSIVLSPKNPQPLELDGDDIGEIGTVRIAVEHRALLVRIPADSARLVSAAAKTR